MCSIGLTYMYTKEGIIKHIVDYMYTCTSLVLPFYVMLYYPERMHAQGVNNRLVRGWFPLGLGLIVQLKIFLQDSRLPYKSGTSPWWLRLVLAVCVSAPWCGFVWCKRMSRIQPLYVVVNLLM